MKRVALFVAGITLAVSAMAEASFDQIEHLIEQRNYAAAASGLEVIIQNHPKSAKAFYAMAQAQAGLGNLEKAQKALNIATGLNPTLDFAPSSSVQSLKDAITPQVAKIEAVEESHMIRNLAYFVMFGLFGWAGYLMWCVYNRKKDEEDAEREVARREALEEYNRQQREREAKVATANAQPIDKTVATASIATSGPAVPQPTYTPSYSAPAPTHTTVVNNSSNDGFLTGMLVGNMLSSSHHDHHHDTERTVIRETVREVPAPSRDSSWDDTPSSSSSSRSSSWDDSSSSSSSSSWSSSSSDSSSSSSWDSGSSSSDSSSSSSWD